MRTRFLALVITGFIAIIALPLSAQQAGTSNGKEIAKENQLTEYQNFKTEQQIRIIENEKAIGKLKNQKTTTDKTTQTNYDNSISLLEQKNNSMIDRLNNYNENDTNKWDVFKTEFNNDMDELNKLISAIAQKKYK